MLSSCPPWLPSRCTAYSIIAIILLLPVGQSKIVFTEYPLDIIIPAQILYSNGSLITSELDGTERSCGIGNEVIYLWDFSRERCNDIKSLSFNLGSANLITENQTLYFGQEVTLIDPAVLQHYPTQDHTLLKEIVLKFGDNQVYDVQRIQGTVHIVNAEQPAHIFRKVLLGNNSYATSTKNLFCSTSTNLCTGSAITGHNPEFFYVVSGLGRVPLIYGQDIIGDFGDYFPVPGFLPIVRKIGVSYQTALYVALKPYDPNEPRPGINRRKRSATAAAIGALVTATLYWQGARAGFQTMDENFDKVTALQEINRNQLYQIIDYQIISGRLNNRIFQEIGYQALTTTRIEKVLLKTHQKIASIEKFEIWKEGPEAMGIRIVREIAMEEAIMDTRVKYGYNAILGSQIQNNSIVIMHHDGELVTRSAKPDVQCSGSHCYSKGNWTWLWSPGETVEVKSPAAIVSTCGIYFQDRSTIRQLIIQDKTFEGSWNLIKNGMVTAFYVNAHFCNSSELNYQKRIYTDLDDDIYNMVGGHLDYTGEDQFTLFCSEEELKNKSRFASVCNQTYGEANLVVLKATLQTLDFSYKSVTAAFDDASAFTFFNLADAIEAAGGQVVADLINNAEQLVKMAKNADKMNSMLVAALVIACSSLGFSIVTFLYLRFIKNRNS